MAWSDGASGGGSDATGNAEIGRGNGRRDRCAASPGGMSGKLGCQRFTGGACCFEVRVLDAQPARTGVETDDG